MRARRTADGAVADFRGALGLVDDDPLLALRTLAIDTLVRLATDPRSQAVFEVIFHKSEMTDDLSPITARRDRERCDCLSHVERMVGRAVTAGQLPPDTDTRLATLALHTYLGGIMREWVLDPAAFDLVRRGAGADRRRCVAGLRTNPPRRTACAGVCRIVSSPELARPPGIIAVSNATER